MMLELVVLFEVTAIFRAKLVTLHDDHNDHNNDTTGSAQTVFIPNKTKGSCVQKVAVYVPRIRFIILVNRNQNHIKRQQKKPKPHKARPTRRSVPKTRPIRTTTPLTTTKKITTTTQPPRPPTVYEKKYEEFEKRLQENVDVCQDFYAFACNTFVANNPPRNPTDDFSAFAELQRQTAKEQMKLVMEDNTQTTSTAVGKMRTFRTNCVDEQTIERLRTTNLIADIIVCYRSLKTLTINFRMLEVVECSMATNGGTWKESSFDLTKMLIDTTKKTGRHSFFDIGLHYDSNDDRYFALFTIASLILQDPQLYDNNNDLQTLEDFVLDIMRWFIHDIYVSFTQQIFSIVAQDMESTRTNNEMKRDVKEVLDLERDIAEIMRENDLKDPRKMEDSEDKVDKKTYDEMTSSLTSIKFDDYMQQSVLIADDVKTTLKNNPNVYVRTQKVFTALDLYLANIDSYKLANYLVIRLVIQNIRFLDLRFVTARNRFKDRLDNAAPRATRKEMCFDLIVDTFRLVTDHLFMQQIDIREARTFTGKMLDEVRQKTKQLIEKETWMDTQTKTTAIQKLQKLNVIIGSVPEAMAQTETDKHYEKVDLKADDLPMGMLVKMRKHAVNDQLMRIVNPLASKQNREMRATSVRPLHYDNANAVFLGAAMFRSPVYANSSLSASINYGALGSLSAAEFLRGFDAHGSLFNELGERNDWWSPKTRNDFEGKAKCMDDEVKAQIPRTLVTKVKDRSVLFDNVANHGGLRTAFSAYQQHLNGRNEKHVPGYKRYTNEQSFFISYAALQCSSQHQNVKDDNLMSEGHLADKFRVNYALSQFDEFARVFNCKVGSPMNPKQRCSVW
ncbi:Neprilysin-1 [Aphelenchoides besseyi]|nr:Neprilysin-1 [Aphelenchoides besseyi]